MHMNWYFTTRNTCSTLARTLTNLMIAGTLTGRQPAGGFGLLLHRQSTPAASAARFFASLA